MVDVELLTSKLAACCPRTVEHTSAAHLFTFPVTNSNWNDIAVAQRTMGELLLVYWLLLNGFVRESKSELNNNQIISYVQGPYLYSMYIVHTYR